jgi:TetR/AcrR family transcriptional repressor of nem operon
MSDDTATEILAATYRALCRHGYADLTLADVADEADRSKAAIHYYYDREALFVEFLDFLYERYTVRLPSVDGGTPRDQLSALLAAVLTDEGAAPDQRLRTALLAVRAQAPYDDAVQTRLSNFDAVRYERLRDIIAAGVESGEFDATVEPAVAAEFLVTAVTGAHTRRVAVKRSSETLYETITWYVDRQLLADEVPEAAH